MYYPDMTEVASAAGRLAQKYAAETGDDSVLEPYKNVFYIGWLDPPTAEPTLGETSSNFKSKIDEICTSKKYIYERFMGHHDCPICGDAWSSKTIQIKDPNSGKKYYFPDMVAHYVVEHQYKPPQEFIDAVLAFDLSAPVVNFDIMGNPYAESFDPKNIANLMEDEAEPTALSIVKEYLEEHGYLIDIGVRLLDGNYSYIMVSRGAIVSGTKPMQKVSPIAIDNPEPGVIGIHNEDLSETISMADPKFFDNLIAAVEWSIDDQHHTDIEDNYRESNVR